MLKNFFQKGILTLVLAASSYFGSGCINPNPSQIQNESPAPQISPVPYAPQSTLEPSPTYVYREEDLWFLNIRSLAELINGLSERSANFVEESISISYELDNHLYSLQSITILYFNSNEEVIGSYEAIYLVNPIQEHAQNLENLLLQIVTLPQSPVPLRSREASPDSDGAIGVYSFFYDPNDNPVELRKYGEMSPQEIIIKLLEEGIRKYEPLKKYAWNEQLIERAIKHTIKGKQQ